MSNYCFWKTNNVIEWLSYMDNRIIFSNISKQQFEIANINGNNLENINGY